LSKGLRGLRERGPIGLIKSPPGDLFCHYGKISLFGEKGSEKENKDKEVIKR
jgi:hypothetical protein